jgi:hypothetical protein
MQTGKIIRIFDLGNKIQILCTDERGLLSVYFERKPFNSFFKAVKKAGLKLNGLLISFNRDYIQVPALGNNREYSTR